MKTFYKLLANTVVASVTNTTVWFAITFFVYLETRSVFATSMIAGIFLVLTALSGFWFGSLVDRYKKKRVMLISSIMTLLAYIVGFAMYLFVGGDGFKDPASLTLWVFVLVLMVGMIIGNIRTIALTTLITVFVPEDRRDKANGLSGTAYGVSFLVTSVISGLLVGLAGMYYVLILAITLTAATIAHLWTVPIEEKAIVQAGGADRKIDIRGTLKVVSTIPGLLALILFSTINNFLGGVFMALLDPYGLSLVSVQSWGLIWGFLSTGFIVGGLIIAKWGLGKNPLRALFMANIVIWTISVYFTAVPSIALLIFGMYIYMSVSPYIEAAEQTIIQKVVPHERQGRVFGFAQSVEQAASPLTAFMIGPLAQFVFIPYMTTGAGARLIGSWFGTGADRGIALVFVLTGIVGLGVTLAAMSSKYYRLLSQRYATQAAKVA